MQQISIFLFKVRCFCCCLIGKTYFFAICPGFASEFEGLFAWLPHINDQLKAFPLGNHYL